MPAAEGTYHAYVDVYAEGLLIAAYQAIEDVVIAALVVEGMITLYGTGVPPHSEAAWPTEWTVGWYYADTGLYERHKEDYHGVPDTPWRLITDPCTPPRPIDLNNLLIKIETYAEDEICPFTGHKGSCTWPVYGPFVVKDGGVYTIDIPTGVLTEGGV